ncbi:cytochrome c biogenesis protein CcdA [Comamonas sp. JUb58]|uniref:cytochrome c biogenesis protein DipZ n=1 Tax=Comamonas sp. JUb58 TaxID=2485114 RepID=UPI00105DE5EC|nr:cytochrome c biogenesis protein CcdA [Comamonas sp. JUb58]TDS78775.1 cytochrome c biogenesis protein CcdA [Comamonas sp. JUb58]
MALYLVAFAAGVLSVLSPCILPVLPFVFARQGQPSRHGSLPLLVGMALAFAAAASLAAAAGAWAVQLSQWGRGLALLGLGVFAASLLFPGLAAWWSRPLVQIGEKLAAQNPQQRWLHSALLGAATGLIWSPCAGPVLGLLLSGAALAGADTATSLLLLSYAAGAGLALWAALRISAGTMARLRAHWLPGERGRRVAGAAMLAAVLAVATGLDSRLLAQSGALSGLASNGLESSLLQAAMPSAQAAELAGNNPGAPYASSLPVESTRPSLDGGTQWLNAEPQSIPALRGKVVLVNFWTYSCVNCLRTLPYVNAWAQKYADRGLVVVGVHAPEFAFEKDRSNVEKALQQLKISYPVVQDNGFRIWRAFNNQYWPALYLVDAQGRVRHHQFGEGGYAATERALNELLREAQSPSAATASAPNANTVPDTQGLGMAADTASLRSPELYLGYDKGGSLRLAGRPAPDKAADYQPASLRLNTWTLQGNWTLKPEWVQANSAGGRLALRFEARDANLVLGAAGAGPLRFRLTIDGQPPGIHHGSDVDAQGYGQVDATRLYQLVRQQGPVKQRTVEIEFLDAGAQGYAFTFG